MTKQEAIEAMERGYKVKHPFSKRIEYIYKNNDDIDSERGFFCETRDFNEIFSSAKYSDGWRMVADQEIDCIEHASMFFKKLKHELNYLTSYDVPIHVDGKLIKDVKLTDDLTIEITTL